MRALVLSGGGSKGAFQAGVLQGLLKENRPWYDAFCGVSVGAINCGYLSQFKTEGESVLKLCEFWQSINTKNIYRNHKPFGWLHGLWTTGLYNTSPLSDLLSKHIEHDRIVQSGKKLRMGAVSMESGKYKLFSESYRNVIDAIMASASYPVMFELPKFEDETWIDGGVRNVTPLKAAIDLGADDIDIIMTTPYGVDKPMNPPKNVKDVAVYSLGMMVDEITTNDIKCAVLYNRLVDAGEGKDKRKVQLRLICPAGSLGDPLDFSQEVVRPRILHGINDAVIQELE